MKNVLIVTVVMLLSANTMMAQGQLKIALKDSTIVDYYIDGKKVDYEIVRLLDPEKLGTVTVLKDEASLKKYNAEVGVVWIESVDEDEVKDFGKIKIRVGNDSRVIHPLYIINGERVERGSIADLNPNDIKDISVVKGEVAKKLYNAEQGVVIVTTKKRKRKKN